MLNCNLTVETPAEPPNISPESSFISLYESYGGVVLMYKRFLPSKLMYYSFITEQSIID